MDDALLVCRRQPVRDLYAVLNRLAQWYRPSSEPFPQRLASSSSVTMYATPSCVAISEREKDYLDAQTWGAASPLHSRGLSALSPTMELNVPEKICAATRANSRLHGKPSLNSLLMGNALPLANPRLETRSDLLE
jgi:hypothetical protein